MMDWLLTDLVAVFTLSLLALALLFRVYKRSVSTFVIILALSILEINAELRVCPYGDGLMVIILAALLLRVIAKEPHDKIFHMPYKGKERREECRSKKL